jgi:hypothetical protein
LARRRYGALIEEVWETRSGSLAALAQSGVLEVPRVQLIRGLVRTRTTTDLGAGDALLRCHRFHSLWVGAAGAKLIPACLVENPFTGTVKLRYFMFM